MVVDWAALMVDSSVGSMGDAMAAWMADQLVVHLDECLAGLLGDAMVVMTAASMADPLVATLGG